jgi:catechol 2,3-dioxygenase-like lactoylglutathione lyase family enzyme
MKVLKLDHLVISVADVARSREFYSTILGMDAREDRSGKWSLHFADQKISLQESSSLPEIARGTVPGSGNFCLIVQEPVEQLAEILRSHGVEILLGPVEKIGAIGAIRSIYFRDPDENLVELSNQL